MKKVCIKQRDITDCGAACLVSVAASYGRHIAVSRVRQIAGTDQRGTNLLGMITAAKQIGFQAKAVRAEAQNLEQLPLPVIAHVQLENGLLHYVVIYRASTGKVEYMDPGTGSLIKVSRDKFQKIWTGVLLLLEPEALPLHSPGNISTYRRLIQLLMLNKHLLLPAFVGALVYTILGLSTSIYIQKLVDTVLVEGDIGLLNLLSLIMILLLCVQQYTGTFKTILGVQIGQRMDAALIMNYLRHLLRLPQFFFDTMRTGEVLSRINDAVMIRNFISETVMQMVVNILVLFCSFFLMFFYSSKLALLLLMLIPVYTVLYLISHRINKLWQRKLMESGAAMETELVGTLQVTGTIKKFGLEEAALGKNENSLIRLLRTVYATGIRNIAINATAEFTTKLFTILVLWVGATLVIDRTLTPGTLLSFYSLIGYFTGPVLILIGSNKSYQEAMIAADRLFEIMELEPEELSGKVSVKQGYQAGDIVFQEVHFRYGSRQLVFNDLSFRISRGSVVGIAGESGSGKSTILHLLLQLYELQKGKITINGIDIKHISLEQLRKELAVVPQDTDIMPGSILENICLDQPVDFDRVVNLCQRIGLNELISDLPEGYHTVLHEQGVNLSGGQKQRIGIARALYREPSVLLLDEATASLDAISEGYVQDCLSWYRKTGATIIIVAHRLATLKYCDEILVLQQGTLVQRGTHESLIQQDGLYYSMWNQR